MEKGFLSVILFFTKKREITASLNANGHDPVERKTLKMQERMAEILLPGDGGWNLESKWRCGLRWEQGQAGYKAGVKVEDIGRDADR